MSYLRYFVLLTKHGTYIDGFAGPQEECETNSWPAKLVLASEPQWIKHFHLCDQNKVQIVRLKELKKVQPISDSKGQALSQNPHLPGRLSILRIPSDADQRSEVMAIAIPN